MQQALARSTLDSKQLELLNTTHSLQPGRTQLTQSCRNEDPQVDSQGCSHLDLEQTSGAGRAEVGVGWAWGQWSPAPVCLVDNTDIQMVSDTLQSVWPAVISFPL